MAKRERGINWEREEKQLLTDIIRPFLKIIEYKDNSTNTNKAKINAWAEITDQFNRANKRPRDKKQVANQWKIMKLKSKKEISLYRRETLQTCGGPKPPSPSPETLEIVELLPQEFAVDYNEYDCDGKKKSPKGDTDSQAENDNLYLYIDEDNNGMHLSNQLTSLTSDSVIIVPEPTAVSQATLSISQPAPSTKTPKCSKKKNYFMLAFEEAQFKHLQAVPEKTLSFSEASFDDMHKFRMLENDRLQKEHELRIKNSTEIHDQVIKNLKLQEEILKEMLNKTKNN